MTKAFEVFCIYFYKCQELKLKSDMFTISSFLPVFEKLADPGGHAPKILLHPSDDFGFESEPNGVDDLKQVPPTINALMILDHFSEFDANAST